MRSHTSVCTAVAAFCVLLAACASDDSGVSSERSDTDPAITVAPDSDATTISVVDADDVARLVITMELSSGADAESTADAIRSRIAELFGVEPEVATDGTTLTVVVEDEPTTDFEPLIGLLTELKAPQVLLRPVLECVDGDVDPTADEFTPSDPTIEQTLPHMEGGTCTVGPAAATGEVFEDDAEAEIIDGGWGIQLELRPGAEGLDLWNDLAASCFAAEAECPSRRLAIEVDGQIISAPTIAQPRFNGEIQITGDFTEDEASALARVLRVAALPPVEFTVTSVDVTRPPGVTADTLPVESTTTTPPTTTTSTTSSTTPSTTSTSPVTTLVLDGFAYGTFPCPDPGGSPLPAEFTDAPQRCIADGVVYTAEVTTNHGTFTIDLAGDRFPGTVNNFVVLARYGYYDGNSCHRVINDFVVQCGRRDDDESLPGYTIPDELPSDGEYTEGVVAMANIGLPDTGGGQWFVITGPNGTALPPEYSIVGTVSSGTETLAALEALADPLGQNGVPPLLPIDIESITITES